MNNVKTIDKVRETAAKLLTGMDDTRTRPFRLQEIQINRQNGAVMLGNAKFEGKALTAVLAHFGIKPKFLGFNSTLDPQDFDRVLRILQTSVGETEMIAEITITAKENSVWRVYEARQDQKALSSAAIGFNQHVNQICDSLGKTDTNWEYRAVSLDTKNNAMKIDLLCPDAEFQVANNRLQLPDSWKGGNSFTFTPLQITINPFFERLVCKNGMSTTNGAWEAEVFKKKFNQETINKRIFEVLQAPDIELQETLKKAAQRMQNTNISVREFCKLTDWLECQNEDGQYDHLVRKNFLSAEPIYKTYGDFREKTEKWQATANAGIKAYDWVNIMTRLASHGEYRMTTEDRRDLQIKAGNFMFGGALDLEDCAPKMTPEYAIVDEMNF